MARRATQMSAPAVPTANGGRHAITITKVEKAPDGYVYHCYNPWGNDNHSSGMGGSFTLTEEEFSALGDTKVVLSR